MRFLLIAIILAGIISFTYQMSGHPVLHVPEVEQDFPVKMPTIKAEEIRGAVEAPRSEVKATVLYVFTTWCPYCKEQQPVIQKLGETMGPNGLQLLGISVDQKVNDANRFASAQKADPSFSIHRVTDASQFTLWLKDKGSLFKGGIPYIAVFDKNGKLVREFDGRTDYETLKAALPL